MEEFLTDRRARILALVVREHIASAQPVGSAVLVRRYSVDCSPATVRHEMAALTEAGLLRQPHTSAGRVPTAEGYRYFVEHLMRHSWLTEAEKENLRIQFALAGRDHERWARLSAALVAECSGAAGVVATVRRQEAPVRRIDLIAVGDRRVHVVAILGDGSVRRWRWRPDAEPDQIALDRLASRVNRALADGRLPDLAAGGAAPDQGPLEEAGAAIIADIIAGLEIPSEPQVVHVGLAQILLEPEFSDSDRLLGVVEFLEQGRGLDRLLAELPEGGVEVLMGGEPPLESVPHAGFVLAPFGDARQPEGLLGVVGPRRLSYERAVPAVRFVARLMTRLHAGDAL